MARYDFYPSYQTNKSNIDFIPTEKKYSKLYYSRQIFFVLPSILKETVALVQFDASDMVVLLSNLLDNAIEACQQYEKEDKTIHVTAIAQQAFFISIRNTSKPVVILNDSIPTTKPEPQLHGFGLVNIHLIFEKYHGEHTMFYENGWFQFTADIPFTPIS